MKRMILVSCMVMMLLGFHGSAGALPIEFALDSIDVELNDQDPGLVLNWSTIGPYDPFELEVGGTHTMNLFTLGTDESWVNWGEDTVWKEITVSFNFSAPPGSEEGTIQGQSRGIWLIQAGYVEWLDDIVITFEGGGEFGIALHDVLIWPLGSPKTVEATITYLQEPASGQEPVVPVPEPVSILLLGMGLLGMAGIQRKIRRKTV